jgi:tetratricopeptide (TPR) repeat protein
MSRSCPSCGQSAEGRFCSHCGASLAAPATCAACSAELLPGARFCNACGAAATGARAPAAAAAAPTSVAAAPSRPSPLPWMVAGAAVLLLAAVLLVPRLGEGDAAPAVAAPFAQGTAGTAGPGAVDLSSMTSREAADRLFDRIMRAVSAGDTAEARQFLPMALGAYARLDSLDAHAHYDLGMLQLIAGDAEAARAEADAILAADDTHLFGLFIAAEAEALRGDRPAALGFYQRFLDAFPVESQRILPEYQAHGPALPGMRAQAEAAVQGAG